jgi:Anti-sigma-K factor rskA
VHCTPEQLALAALREPLPADDARHLERCGSCRDQVAALQRGVDALAVPALAATGPAVAPPPAVWEAIAAATGVQVSPRPERMATDDTATDDTATADMATADSAGTVHPRPAPTRPADLPGPGRLGGRAAVPPQRGTDVPRFRRRLALTAAAAAVLGAGIALGAVTVAQRPEGAEVAATRLQAFDNSGASGTAVVVENADHTLELKVTLQGPRPADGYYEAWLANAGLDRMVAVGALHAGTTTLPLPAGLSVGNYPVVDVSVQQLNGNPAHSDHSVARGLLR